MCLTCFACIACFVQSAGQPCFLHADLRSLVQLLLSQVTQTGIAVLACCAALPPVGDVQALLCLHYRRPHLPDAVCRSCCPSMILILFSASHMQAWLCWTMLMPMYGVHAWSCLQARQPCSLQAASWDCRASMQGPWPAPPPLYM